MNILLTGSIAYDYLMSFPGYFRDYILPDRLDSISLSFLVESMVRRRGGTAPNIAYTLALLGERSRILATVGEDFEEYRSWLETHGVDTSAIRVIPGEYTASFFANTDRSNAQIASFYPGAMAHAGDFSLQQLNGDQPDLVMISPNDPRAMIRYVEECQELGIPYLYDPSQQIPRLDGDDLRVGVEAALALFVNDYELGMVEKRTGMDLADVLDGSHFTVVTRGEYGATIYAEGGETSIPAVAPKAIVDPTGVGDAFRGGFLKGFSRGWEWEICGRLGALAATYCLEQEGPQGHTYTRAEFVTRYRSHFDDGGILDELLGD
ncbi:MAG TPA: carbohydrate kinase family protein [Anaerolineales bacterium]|jgi:adenosine kinase|nr:carbohydrate kinase family protein [Anaerolineales bacterium]